MKARIDLAVLHERARLLTHDIFGFVLHVVSRFHQDRGFQIASALTYTCLLSLVPLLAIFLGVLSSFPAFGDMRDEVTDLLLSPLVPEVSFQARIYIDQFLANTQQLTLVGIIGLAVTALLLLSTIETAFNDIWRVPEPRPLVVRILSFWAVLTMGPLLVAGGLSASHSLANLSNFGAVTQLEHLLQGLSGLVPIVLTTIALTVLFRLLPNRRIPLRFTATGALASALLLAALNAGFGLYLERAETYRVVYGALAAIPIFLLWMYSAWVTVMVGAEIAASLSEWRAMRARRNRAPTRPGERLAIALVVLRTLWRASVARRAVSHEDVEDCFARGALIVDEVVADLMRLGYVAQTEDGQLVTVRDLDCTTLYDLQAELGLDIAADIGPELAPGPQADNDEERQWLRQLIGMLQNTEDCKRHLMNVPIRTVIMTEDAGQPRPALLSAPAASTAQAEPDVA